MRSISRQFTRRIRSFVIMEYLACACLVSSFIAPAASADDWALSLTSADDLLLSDHMSWSERLWAMDRVDQFKLFMSDISMESDGLVLLAPFGETGPVIRASMSMPSETARCMHNAGAGNIGAISDDFEEAYLIIRKRW